MIARRRAQWRKYQGRIDPRRLVFIDETWAKTNMTRLRGWCARACRWSTISLTATGARSPFWLHSGMIASTRHSCLMPPSTARALPPMSSSSCCLPSRAATSSSWTISAAQEQGRATTHPLRRRQAPLSAALLARPQPNRAGLCQAQDPAPQGQHPIGATWKQIRSLLEAFPPHECANYLRNSGYASA